jgi:hypothetical protein
MPMAEHDTDDASRTRRFLAAMADSLGIPGDACARVEFSGTGNLPSVFAVSDFATAAVACAASAMSELLAGRFAIAPQVTVNRRLASLWFGWSIRPEGWTLPPLWDPIAGNYATRDGWIRLHTNAPHHRDAALAALRADADKSAVARAVSAWNADELEAAIVASKGCAAAMRTMDAWDAHPQGRVVSAQPLFATQITEPSSTTTWSPTPDRPLRGLRVLDLTRVLAGPVATRFLAGFGADVLRIDPPQWDEPGVIPEVSLGKRCARLDLRDPAARTVFTDLLRNADVLVHGYRRDALENIGFGTEARRAIRPGLIDVTLNAYGWDGPWRNRRGFDSLVQMSAGIADAGMRTGRKDQPTPLPVQALDHATGYVMAAAVLHGLAQRVAGGHGFEARTSLAHAAHVLVSGPRTEHTAPFDPPGEDEWSDGIEKTDFGPARRLTPPVKIEGTSMRWDRPAARLGSSAPAWVISPTPASAPAR